VIRLILVCLLIILPTFVIAQSGFDVTGRASLRFQNTSYDEKSKIKPDSVEASEYGKTDMIPGLQQSLNLSLFGRTKDLDLTLLADIKNNEWNSFDFKDLNSVSRLTLNMRISNHEIIVGDFFESGNDVFIQSREIRGGKYRANFPQAFGNNSFIEASAMGGIVQKAFPIGTKSLDLYKQFETTGQYRRLLAAGAVKFGQLGLYDLSLNYLWGKDQESSIDSSFNEPIGNMVYGANANLYFWNRNIRLFGDFYQSDKDTLTLKSSKDNSYKGGFDFRYDNFKLILLYQRLGYNYFTAGYPFLENDKKGFRGQSAYAFPKVVTLFTDFEFYDNNLEEIETIPKTKTQIANAGITTYFSNFPELTLKYGYRFDNSPVTFDSDSNSLKTNKITTKLEGKISYNFGKTQVSLSAIHLDLDDKSLIGSGSPLGTKQLITSFNFYSRALQSFFISGGAVYSTLELTNEQKKMINHSIRNIRRIIETLKERDEKPKKGEKVGKE